MEDNLLYESEEEKIATGKVLAAFKIKSVNEQIDNYVAEVLKYAVKIDEILEENKLEKRYLNRVSTVSDGVDFLTFDADLETLDFRINEVIEDLIKRINTRLKLINDANETLNKIHASYDLSDINLEEAINAAKLTEEELV